MEKKKTPLQGFVEISHQKEQEDEMRRDPEKYMKEHPIEFVSKGKKCIYDIENR